MAWASIADRNCKRLTPKLKVILNITNNDTHIQNVDDIPRHREITPDPADDFIMTNKKEYKEYDPCIIPKKDYWPNWSDGDGWVDYKTDDKLNFFKLSLPISIQEIIRYNHSLKRYNKVINLNFKDIEKDLKFQYKKYKGNKQKLKALFFKYDPNDKTHIDDKRFAMLLRMEDIPNTPVHYLFVHIEYIDKFESLSTRNKIKCIKQMLKFIRLLIINDIINVEYPYFQIVGKK